jgi:hypothetical protein
MSRGASVTKATRAAAAMRTVEARDVREFFVIWVMTTS